MKKIIVLSSLFLTLIMQAQDRTQPKPGPAPKINIKKPETFSLPNGLKVLVVENHKLPRVSATLTITPFFAVFIYYKNFETVIFVHAVFLFIMIAMRELTKDLENIKGDLANDYQTIPILYGEIISKKIITFLTVSTVLPVYILIEKFDIGYMDMYFYSCLIVLILFLLQKYFQIHQPHRCIYKRL